ncbi:sulfatase-like hydrolase/transferase [Qipengyuania marisflavi]|uniref:Sulfatase n=1 Tax=Qipengyuania marisflavi TaxID=2486356 RepID=A0A5S3PAI6_9SPHN|nr:sulfatase-like hydrolase/transferase [Qipengyuania marisflavi]TMM49755.1 sulfatase [Qipengyuania marisflavi]
MTARNQSWRGWLKFALFALIAALSLPQVVDRFADIHGFAARLVYLALLAIAWVGILGASWVRNHWLRWALAALFAAAAYYVDTFARASGAYLTYDAHINMLASSGFIGDALAQNRAAFLGAILPATALLLGIGLAPINRSKVPTWPTLAGPIVATIIITLLLFVRGGDGAKGLPDSYTGFAYSLLASYEHLQGGLGPRESVTMQAVSAPLYRDIVLIVDESVAGNYLDIGSPEGVATPLSQDWAGLDIANFGIAAAITNCSVGTNAALRFGGTRANYLRQIAKGPSLWDYAKGAGLQTVYIDAQRTDGAYQNLMDDAERASIDRFIQFGKVTVRDRDMAAADALLQEMADDRAAFIIVNKMGAHFPVHDKYPDGAMQYRPALPRGGYTDIGDTGSREGFAGAPDDWRRYRNSYRNTLLWNVSAFFDKLLESGTLNRALVIYTADHGQDLHEDGHAGTTTHCQSDPAPSEGAVPLVAIQGKAGALAFQPYGTASHYMIAPTLLAAMGYDRAAVRSEFGGALDEPSSDPGTFNTLFNARLGRKPVWQLIEPALLPASPASDCTLVSCR